VTDLWTTTEVAQWWGIAPKSVPSTMCRLGVFAHNREPGRRGQNRYAVDEVRRAKQNMVGRGYRSDLHTEGEHR
jgi:hypothetical protein